MRQAAEDGVSEVLSSVVEDVGQAMDRNMNGAHILHELLSAPWLRAVLKMYESLLQFQRLTPSPFLPYASGLSHEIMSGIQKVHRPSAEARELFGLLSSPHIQALLSSHDSVAQSDYGPVLPPLPDEMPEDEEAMRIVCLVKNNQPLNREVQRRGSIGDGIGMIRSRWSSLRRFTLDRLVPARRAWSGEELRATESEAMPLPLPRAGQSRPFLPRYQSTGSCCLCPQTAELQKKRLNQSAPSVFGPAPCTASFLEKCKHVREERGSTGGSSDDYAYPPPPVPAYSLSLPSSPVLYQRVPAGGQSRNIPTPGRTPSGTGAHTAPCSPASLRSSQQQGVSHGRRSRSAKTREEEPRSAVPNSAHNVRRNQPKQRRNKQLKPKPQPPDLSEQCSREEVTSTVDTSSVGFDALHLEQKVTVATKRTADSGEENTQALNLLAEVVDKLQGLIVASKNQEVSPLRRLKKSTPPTPPPRVSSISPKVVRKPPTPYPHQLSTASSSSSRSSSSSSSSVSEDFETSQSLKLMNGGSKRTVVTFGPSHRADGSGPVRLNNGTVSKAPMENKQDCNSTGCLTAKKKKKKKK